MIPLTDEHKREYNEARDQALAAVARLNKLFEETDRAGKYRARFVIYERKPGFDDDDQDPEPDDMGAGERAGNERAEREDESEA